MRFSIITPTIRPEFLNITQECLENQTFQDFEWLVECGLRNKGFTLSQDLNKMLKRAKGEIVVMLQDCIKVEPDFLEKINALEDLENTFYTFPIGKIIKEDDEPKWDWRHFFDVRDIQPQEWEADLATAPLKAFKDIGGYDERYDEGWSWENCGVAYRANYLNYKFKVVPQIEGIAIDHDAIRINPFRNKRINNDKRANETKNLADRGIYKLHYLD